MTAKKPVKATPKTPPTSSDEYTERVPIKPCRSWAAAARQARGALCFIVNDGRESAANRIKAAEVILDRAMGKPAAGADAGDAVMPFENWLDGQGEKSRL